MSAMIRSTAGNAAQAKDLAVQARSAAEAGARTMLDMNAAMRAIEDSSAEVAKIVKDIDEIAFQTNILALNAAVEAARAGTAGAGFAVVADEVRSLAQRSAAAARETAAKIEAAIASSRLGAELLREHVGWLRSLVSAQATTRRIDAATTRRPPAPRPAVTARPAGPARSGSAVRPPRPTAAPRIPMPGDHAGDAVDAEERNFRDF